MGRFSGLGGEAGVKAASMPSALERGTESCRVISNG